MTCAWVCWAMASAKPPVPHPRLSTSCEAARSASLTKCGSHTSMSSGRNRVSNSIGSDVAGCVQYSCMRTSLARPSRPYDCHWVGCPPANTRASGPKPASSQQRPASYYHLTVPARTGLVGTRAHCEATLAHNDHSRARRTKRSTPVTSPRSPTYRCHPWVTPASTASRARTEGGDTASR